jgi:hypothetical protein
MKAAGFRAIKFRYRQREYVVELTDADLLTATNRVELEALLQSRAEEIDALEILEATEDFPALNN